MSEDKFYKLEKGEFSMYFMHSIRNIFNFYGRASRKEFLVFLIAMLVYSVLLLTSSQFVVYAFQIKQGAATTNIGILDTFSVGVANVLSVASEVLLGLYMLLSLTIAIMHVSLYVRRFHDFNWSGWWLPLLWLFPSCISWGLQFVINYFGGAQVMLMMIVSFVIQWGLPAYIMLREPSDKDENVYGEPMFYGQPKED